MQHDRLSELFPSFEKELLDDLTRYSTPAFCKAGSVLIRRGQPMQRMVIVIDGLLKLYRQNDDADEFLLLYFIAGSAYGVSFYNTDQPGINQSMLKAAEDSWVLWLPLSVKDQLVRKFDSWYKFMMQTSVSHYRVILETFDSIAFQKMDERLGYYFRRLTIAQKSTTVRISHQEIARDLNSSREVISRPLKKMEELGKIRIGHNMIDIIDL